MFRRDWFFQLLWSPYFGAYSGGKQQKQLFDIPKSQCGSTIRPCGWLVSCWFLLKGAVQPAFAAEKVLFDRQRPRIFLTLGGSPKAMVATSTVQRLLLENTWGFWRWEEAVLATSLVAPKVNQNCKSAVQSQTKPSKEQPGARGNTQETPASVGGKDDDGAESGPSQRQAHVTPGKRAVRQLGNCLSGYSVVHW